MITSFHHTGCLVPDMAEAIADYQILHPEGSVSEVYDIPEQDVKVCFFRIYGMNVEFVQPTNETSTLYRQMKKTPGYYHIGLYVDDIDAEISRLEAAGYRPLNKFSSAAFEGRFCAFLFNLEMHLVELIEKPR